MSSDIGICDDLIRRVATAEHPAGPQEDWPAPLRIAVQLALRSRMPMAVLWGPQLFAFYNDAYAELIGPERHPALMGRPFGEFWREQWHITGPQIDAALIRREATWAESQPGAILRDGEWQDTWWTYGYSPIEDPSAPNGVGGVLLQCLEVTNQAQTEKVAAEALALRAAQAALARREEQLSLALEGTNDGLWDWDVKTGEVYHSPRFAEQLGYGPDEWDSSYANWLANVHPDDIGQTEKLLSAYLAGEADAYNATFRMRSKDGGWRWILSRARAYRDESGTVTRMVGAHTDITAQKEAEAALKRSEARLSLGVDVAGLALGVMDYEADTITLDERAGALFDLPAGAPIPRARVHDRFHPDEAEAMAAQIAQLIGPEGEGFLALEHRILRSDGSVRWVSARKIVHYSETAGRARHAVSGMLALIDVTTLKLAQDAVVKSEIRYRTLVEQATSVVWTMTPGGEVGEPIPAWQAFTGQSFEEFKGHGFLQAIHAEDRPKVMAAWQAAREREDAYAAEYRLRRHDGVWRTVLAQAAPVRNGAGGIVEWSGACTDVTEQRAAEQALRESEDSLKALNATLETRVAEALAGRRLWADIIEASDAFILALDADFKIIAINSANVREFTRTYGRPPILGESLLDFLAPLPELRAEAQAAWARALGGEAFSYVDDFSDEASDTRWYELKFSPLRDAAGEVIAACQICYEVTDRIRQHEALAHAQAQLFESQKVETIGQLTGGIAHDFNNLLAAISSNLELLQKRLGADERAERLLEGAMKGTERGIALTKRLLAFARRQELRAEPVDVRKLFAGIEDLLARSLGPGVEICSDLPADLPPVLIDANQLELAVLNIAVNARDAMPLGGQLDVFATPEIVPIGARADLAPGRYVRLVVADNGSGMDEATLKRATEPFFTTKGVGKGTGLGLSMVQGLIVQSGGAFEIDSAPGRGTRVQMWLPQADRAAAPSVSPHTDENMTDATFEVLLVDDDVLVRMGTAAMLEDLGHVVTEASNGREALALLQDRADIDLVITDQAMPGITGAQLAAQLAHLHPSLPVIIATGYAQLPEGEGENVPRLAKPFDLRELSRAIRMVMRGSGGGRKVVPFKRAE